MLKFAVCGNFKFKTCIEWWFDVKTENSSKYPYQIPEKDNNNKTLNREDNATTTENNNETTVKKESDTSTKEDNEFSVETDTETSCLEEYNDTPLNSKVSPMKLDNDS